MCGNLTHTHEPIHDGPQVVVEVAEVFIDEDEVQVVGSGNNIRVKLRGVDEQDVVCVYMASLSHMLTVYLLWPCWPFLGVAII